MKLVLKIIGLTCWALSTFAIKFPFGDKPPKFELIALGLLLFFGADLLPD